MLTTHSTSTPRTRSTGVAPIHASVLIVEGDRNASVALTFMLGVSGYEDVRAVRSGARALILSAQYRPSIVFVDLDMPDQGAIALAGDLRRESKQRAMRLIALTSDAEHPAREAARAAGFEKFLVNPATQAELDKCLGKPAERGR
jgi:CheY-like chemotaxis protein